MSGDVLQTHWFGLPLPEGVKAVRQWGARAIIRQDTSRPPVTGDMFLIITGTSAPGPPAAGGWKRRTRAGTGRHAT